MTTQPWHYGKSSGISQLNREAAVPFSAYFLLALDAAPGSIAVATGCEKLL
jgi:hypothetical protein